MTTNNQQNNLVFSNDFYSGKELRLIEGAPITDFSAIISSNVTEKQKEKGNAFAREMVTKFVSDFEKTEDLVLAGKADASDRMVHVSTFTVINDILYMTYYANTKEPSEDPTNQTARFVYCPVNDLSNKTFLDIQTIGDSFSGKQINMVYDTILMPKDDDTIYIMWTARVEENYYRFYRPFTISTQTLGEVRVNRFKVGEITNDFSVSGIKSALAANGLGCKTTYSDIGIMQKLSSRIENGERYYYSGAYSGDFNCIIKSKDLVTWEYVASPDFLNQSQWENAVYVIDDKCFYFVRQWDSSKYGFLTYYDLIEQKWETPVLIEDCQSRSDFIVYEGELYLFHAPIDRDHIGIIRIDQEQLAASEVILQADMKEWIPCIQQANANKDTVFSEDADGSIKTDANPAASSVTWQIGAGGLCFYPFIQYYQNGELAMSYTIARKHIRLSRFTLRNYLDATVQPCGK